jgi:hypothetical protein
MNLRLTTRRQLPFLLTVATFVVWFVLLRPTTLGGPTATCGQRDEPTHLGR